MIEYRTGLGWDNHRIAPGRPLIIGGITIPSDFGLEGHSDADVLLHAITDALLGAAAIGDIGMHFPDTDPRWKDVDSAHLLRDAVALVAGNGWRLVNCDLTIHAQAPKLVAFKQQMRESVASLLSLGTLDVNVKAKTGEHVGPVGQGEAICCDAVVLIDRA